MADRYWVGGTGDWSGTNTTNWSTASGGAGGASVPTIADNVFFDQNSDLAGAAFVVTITQSASSLNFTVQNLDSAMTLAGSNNLEIDGNLSLPATNFTATYTGNLTFNSSSPRTVNTNGVTLACNIFINMSPSTLTLQAALTTTGSVTLSVGTLILGGFALTCASFLSSNSATRSITFGTTGSINLSGSGTVWNTSTTTGFTYTGTSNVRLTNSGSTTTAITTGNLSSSQALNFNVTAGTYSLTLGSTAVFNNLNFTGFSGSFDMAAISATVYGNTTFSNTMTTSSTTGVLTLSPSSGGKTITSNGNSLALALTLSGTGSTLQLVDNLTITKAFTYSGNTLDLNSNSLSVQSFASPSGTRVIAFGTGSITTTGTGTVWNVSGTIGLSYTGISNITISNNTATAVTITNTATAASAMNFNIVNGTYALTLTSGNSYRNLNFTGFSGTWSPAATTHTMYGNLTISATTQTISPATAGNDTITFASTSGTNIITTNNWVINCGIAINGAGGTVQFADLFGQGPSYSLKLTNGTLDINSQSTSAGIFTILSGTHAISNGILTCASVTHTSGDLSIGTGYNVVCNGLYTFTAGSITINDGVNLSINSMSSSNTNTRSIAFGTGSITTTGTGTVWSVTGTTGLSYTGISNIIISNNTATSITITNTTSAASALNFYFINGTYNLLLTTGNVYNDLNFTGFAGAVLIGTNTNTLYGNLIVSNTASVSGSAATTNFAFAATGVTRTITTGNRTVNFGVSFNGVGSTFQLADNFIQSVGQYFQIVNGTIDFNNVTYSLGTLVFVNGTKSYINYGGTLAPAAIIHTSGNVTLDTGAVITTAGSYTFSAGTITLNNGVNLSVGSFISSNNNTRLIAFGTSAIIVTGTATVWNVTGTTGLSYNGTSNIVVSNTTTTGITISNNTGTAANAMNFNFINGTYALTFPNTGGNFNDLNFTGFAGTADLVTTTHTIYGNLIVGSTATITGTGGTGNFIFSATSGTRTVTTSNRTVTFGVNFNGLGGTFQLADNFIQAAAQSFIITNGTVDFNNVTYSLGALTFVTGTKSYINYGGTLAPASVLHTSGNVILDTGALITTTGSYTFTSGNIILNNGVNLSVGSFISNNNNTRLIAFGTGSITVNGTGTIWNVAGTTGLSYTGTSNIIISNNTATAATISNNTGTAANAMNFNFINGTYTLTLPVTGVFNNLNFTGFAGIVAFSNRLQTLYGNLIIGPNTSSTGTSSANGVTWTATSGTRTITTNGRTINFGITINGVGQTVRLTDALVQGSSQYLYLTNGTLDLAGYSNSFGVLSLATGNRSFINGNINCTTVNHDRGDLTVNPANTVIATGAYNLTIGNLTINSDATLSVGSMIFAVGAKSIAFNTGRINLTGTGTVWNSSLLTTFSYTGTSNIRLTNSGSTATTITTGAMTAAQALNYYVTAGTYTLTLTNGNVYRDLNFTGFAGTVALSATTHTMYGNLTLGPSTNTSATAGTNNFAWTSTSGIRTITTNSRTANFGININGAGQTVQLADNFTQGATQVTTLTAGTLDINGKTLTAGATFAAPGAVAKNITFNSGTLICTASTTTAFNASGSNLTTTAGTGNGVISMSGATAKTFVGGGVNYAATLSQDGLGNLTITGNNTFANIRNTVQPTAVLFTANSTNTFSNFSLSGTSSNLVTITSPTAFTHTLSKSGSDVQVSYCAISYSNATGGATWRAPGNLGNLNNNFNTGWNFSPTSTTVVLSNMIAFF